MIRRKCNFCKKEFEWVRSRHPNSIGKAIKKYYKHQIIPITIGNSSYHSECFNDIVKIIRQLQMLFGDEK